MSLAEFYQKQISFTEWFEKINHQNTEEMRVEDNFKRERLDILNKVIGLPYDKPTKFPTSELASSSSSLQEFLIKNKKKSFNLRLVPKDNTLPKLRMVKLKPNELLVWFRQQDINPEQYWAYFVPLFENTSWSTNFVVNNQGVFGEIIRGEHHQISQGFYNQPPVWFAYDFEELKLSEKNESAKKHLQKVFSLIKIKDQKKQEQLTKVLSANFSNNFLCGYFEAIFSGDKIWFLDYNRILGKQYQNFSFLPFRSSKFELRGQIANPGKAQGLVRIIPPTCILKSAFLEGEVLVCEMTTPDYIPLMQKASAIITDKGGILSHAAIVSRELRIPCIVGTGKATQKLKEGDFVEVDAEKGIIKLIN